MTTETKAPQPVLQAYSIDADPAGIRALVCDAITGALALGAQNESPAPDGHWLAHFWQLGRQHDEWRATVWAVARALNCLPSTFSDANGHVLRAAERLMAERSAVQAPEGALRVAAQRVLDDCIRLSNSLDGSERHNGALAALRAALAGQPQADDADLLEIARQAGIDVRRQDLRDAVWVGYTAASAAQPGPALIADKLADELARALKIIGPDWEDSQGRPLKAWHARATKLVVAQRAQTTTKQTKEPTNDR